MPPHFYDADSIAQGLGGYNDPEHQRSARRMIDRLIAEHLERLEDFGFESTYSGASRPGIVVAAHRACYRVEAVFVGTETPDINLERVEARVRAGIGHFVSEAEIRRRWTASQDKLVATKERFHAIRLYDNSGPRIIKVFPVLPTATRPGELPPAWARVLGRRIGQLETAPDPEDSGEESPNSSPEREP